MELDASSASIMTWGVIITVGVAGAFHGLLRQRADRPREGPLRATEIGSSMVVAFSLMLIIAAFECRRQRPASCAPRRSTTST